ncbi:MAG: hypothetical protein K2Z81_21930, partial [Cyanobacteria bacterium]|nr:hypothetical protein [Cyanobacteriota bacterium]
EVRDLIVVSECVRGGSTTAMAVLTALGFDAGNSVSSSLQQANHEFRGNIVRQGLERAMIDLGTSSGAVSALAVIAAVGDPMQPFAAGLAIGASRRSKVLLAGGSQMIAVYALLRAITRSSEVISLDETEKALVNVGSKVSEVVGAECEGIQSTQSIEPLQQYDTVYGESGNQEFTQSSPSKLTRQQGNLQNIVVATTKWVATDSSARVVQLANHVGVPFMHSTVGMGQSRHAGLRAYEQGHVKEGVGAGAALVLASLMGCCSQVEIVDLIDSEYDRLVR